jgi:signal transduction histidine kinase
LQSSPIKQRLNLYRRIEENESHLQDLEQQIRSLQKLATLGTLSCMTGHEFNNILLLIIDYAELALRNPEDAQLSLKALNNTVKHGNRAANLIRTMLSVGRDKSVNAEQVHVAPVVEECFQCLVRDLRKDGIAVKLDIPADLTVIAVRSQLQQVMLNLIINARQAMIEKRGALTISAKMNNEADMVQITVADTGPGIAPEVLERIFEPFFTTKSDAERPDQKGTGLGLAICKDIIQEHQGTIKVSSELGSGAVFSITLPAGERTPASAPAK